MRVDTSGLESGFLEELIRSASYGGSVELVELGPDGSLVGIELSATTEN